jgi:hypothetical protein
MADSTARFSNWFQIVSNVAIIFGLGLVVYELNQSKQFIHAELANEHFTRLSNRQLTIMGEDPRNAIAKAALRPSALNERDAVTLQAFYTEVINGWSGLHLTSEVIGADLDWRFAVEWEARLYFSTEPGRRWLEAWSTKHPGMQEITTLALAAVRDHPGNSYRSQYELLLANE